MPDGTAPPGNYMQWGGRTLPAGESDLMNPARDRRSGTRVAAKEMADSPLGQTNSASQAAEGHALEPSGSKARPGRFLLPWTGAWILGLDWLLFSQNAISLGLATPLIIVLGFGLGATGTYLLQRRWGHDERTTAGAKALMAGIAVGVPWPIFGTAIGGWVLLASGLSNFWGNRRGAQS